MIFARLLGGAGLAPRAQITRVSILPLYAQLCKGEIKTQWVGYGADISKKHFCQSASTVECMLAQTRLSDLR